MSEQSVYQCQCSTCSGSADHPNKRLHHQMNLLLSRLDEQERRWYVALEARKLGHGGIELLSKMTGLSVPTIRRGQQELDEELAERPTERVRLPGGGRKALEKKNPGMKPP
jgi:hypothetical protein